MELAVTGYFGATAISLREHLNSFNRGQNNPINPNFDDMT